MASSIENRPRSRSRSSDHNERLEPHLLRAAEADDVPRLEKILATAKAKDQLNENFLRIGLMRSSEKGKINATQYLLSQGALPDGVPGNRLSPLLRAVERNHIAIVHTLLEHGASPETADKKGRTALMTAAWKNHWHILNSLIAKHADVNAKDERGRNVLHNLAADKQCDWGDSVIELLLKTNIAIDGELGQDKLGRTPLHWACATGKLHLAEMLLNRPKLPRASIYATEIRGKTPLHLAAAHDFDYIVDMLLRKGADVHARSDGAWTPLHNACEVGSLKIVQTLIAAESDVNAKLLNGATPLHLAAQGGHIEVVKVLLECREIKRAARDTFGSTPFLRAAQNKRKDIVSLLAPFNHLESLSEDALGACNGFNATIVDFGNFRNENRVKKWTVFELLYGRDPINPRKPKHTVLPNDKATDFRWIHLPANNMAWVEVLLTKLFIEEGACDVEGFKALEKSFSHQHRGQQSHSHFMRPLCQSTPRAAREKVEPTEEAEQGPPTIIINGGADTPKKPFSRGSTARDDSNDMFRTPSRDGKEREYNKNTPKDKAKKIVQVKGNKSPKIGSSPASHPKEGRKQDYHEERRPHSPNATPRKEPTNLRGNIFTFMPYLHFESTRRRQEMQDAIKRAEIMRSPMCPYIGKASTYDEMLIRAHLASSTAALHVRRTLDQSFYHNIDTESRDQDQVVHRYQLRCAAKDAVEDIDPKIVMVDQLWMWVLGPNLLITSFPQRWQQPKNDPLNVLDSVIEDINSKTRTPITSVHDLAVTITSRCTGVFDRHRMGDEEYQFLDMFESSIGSATNRETLLFKEFNTASAQASAWLQHHRRPTRLSRFLSGREREVALRLEAVERQKFLGAFDANNLSSDHTLARGPRFIDKLLDIGLETDLLAETKDIRDELNMMTKILLDQASVLPDLSECISSLYLCSSPPISSQAIKRSIAAQLKSIEMHLQDLARMDRQAERIYKSITDMLDLKQKHANAFEARFARDQAAGTMRQGQTIMVFTIVTIVFLPLSFIAAFFAINIKEFPKEGADALGNGGTSALPLAWVARYMFGIGLAVSIPLVAIALSLDDIVMLGRWIGVWWARRRASRGKLTSGSNDGNGMGNGNGRTDTNLTSMGTDMHSLTTHQSIIMNHLNRNHHNGTTNKNTQALDLLKLEHALSNARTDLAERNGSLSHPQRPSTSHSHTSHPTKQIRVHDFELSNMNTGMMTQVRRGGGHGEEDEPMSPTQKRVQTGFRMRSSLDIERGLVPAHRGR